MVFWRKKKNAPEQEQQEQEDRVIHHPGDPAITPVIEEDPEISPELQHELEETEAEILEELEAVPVPEHTPFDDAKIQEEEKQHDEEEKGGGWLSRLTSGLSKSSGKISKGISDLVTKKKLDQETLNQLEDVLIEADLGPKTAATLVESFAKDRFGKDVSDQEIKEALATNIEEILEPVAKPLLVETQTDGPFVILVCGVNGAGKTTTIGKMAHNYSFHDKLNVMIAAGDTFRAAATEQLEVWAKRVKCSFLAKEEGADSAAVAYEAYAKAKEDGVDVLLIDTAGRLQNKKNLMAELQKIIQVLKKQNEKLPHSTLLVLDATTGQNAYSQVEAFKEMVDISGLIVTKLDGSAKGGVLVGLADQFGVPVHAIGVGEGIEDMQAFSARDYARSLIGVEEV